MSTRPQLQKRPMRCLLELFTLVIACCLITSCESGDGQGGLELGPDSPTIGPNVSSFTVAAIDGWDELSTPLEWRVSNPSLGTITSQSGLYAVYSRTSLNGVNTVTARDQHKNEGHLLITQVAEDTERPAFPVVATHAETTTATDSSGGTSSGTSSGGGITLSVSTSGESRGEPVISGLSGPVSIQNAEYSSINMPVAYDFTAGSSSGRVFNIQRDTSGNTVSFQATIDGVSYSYP